MGVKCHDIACFIEEFAPLWLAEDWDNSGMLIGDIEQDINRVMVCLDVTSKVADEAADKKVDLIVAHHPVIYNGIKKIIRQDIKGKIIFKLINNEICVYCAHTNLDAARGGVNEYLAGKLGLTCLRNLRKYRSEKLYKIAVFVPEENIDNVRDGMCGAGAGWIGNYSDCTFMVRGVGTFRPLEGTNPYTGSQGNLEKVNEYRLETIVAQGNLDKVVSEMIKVHPYEEVAYDVYPMEIGGREYGMGIVGMLEKPVNLNGFISTVKNALNVENIKLIGSITGEIKKVAVFCGSFDEDYSGIIKESVDMLVTGDIKYHTAVHMAEMGLCVIDAGHFNTERIILPGMVGLLEKRFPDIEVISSSMEKEPFRFC